MKKRYQYKKYTAKRKTFLKKKGFWFFVLGLAGFCGVVYVLFFSGLLKIKTFEIRSTVPVNEQGIGAILEAKLSKGFLGNSFLFFDSDKTEKEILRVFPEIKKAQVKKRLQKIIVWIEKRNPALVICFQTKENCFLVDTEAIIFEKAGASNLPLILSSSLKKNFLEQAFPKNIWVQIEEISSFFQGQFNLAVAEFELENERFLKAKTQQGWYAYFDLQSDLKLDLVKLRLLLENEITPEQQKTLEYIDLRFSKAYYKQK